MNIPSYKHDSAMDHPRIPIFFHNKKLLWVFAFVTFALIFVFHTFPLGLSDFWWHMNTGRWIWLHGELPVDDPFLFTSVSPLDERAIMILHGYPLFQLLVYGVYSLGGLYALLLLKGGLMMAVYGLLWSYLRRNGMHSILALAIVGLLPLLFFRFDDFRPQIFTFIFVLLELHLVENILGAEKRGIATSWGSLLMLPFIMLLWGNLHGGFVIGMAIILIFMLEELIARIRRKSVLSDGAYRRLWVMAGLTIFASGLNPAGMSTIPALFTDLSDPITKVIDEYLGTITYFEFHNIKYTGYLIVAAAVIPAFALLLKWRRLSISHVLLLAPFLVAGISSFRFSLLMVTVVIAIAGAYFSRELNRWLGSYKGAPMILLWCLSSVLLASNAFNRTSLAGSPLEAGIFPTGAVNYLAQSRPQGNVFNFYEYGGYLSWQLYPRKIFIDQRTMSWDTYEAYSSCWRGDYAGVFDKYRIDAVIYPVEEGRTGKVTRLAAGLLNDGQWGIGYYDGRDIVFVKRGAGVPLLDKRQVIGDITRRARG